MKTLNALIVCAVIALVIFAIVMVIPVLNTPLGINATPAPYVVATSPRNVWAYNTQRFTDDEAGVVCWVYPGTYGASISCLPIKDTLLAK